MNHHGFDWAKAFPALIAYGLVCGFLNSQKLRRIKFSQSQLFLL